jgi:hypothetical protein
MKYFYLNTGGSSVYNYERWKGFQDTPYNFYLNLTPEKFPEFEPLFSSQVLERTPPTGIMRSTFGQTTKGFLINDKLKPFFGQFNIKNYKYHKIELLVQKKNTHLSNLISWNEPYSYFQIVNTEYLEWIDFKKSIFLKWENVEVGEEREEYKIYSIEEFIIYKELYGIVAIKYLVLNSFFWNEKLDIFYANRLGVWGNTTGIIVSEKFKEKFIKEKIKGVERFVELPIYKE